MYVPQNRIGSGGISQPSRSLLEQFFFFKRSGNMTLFPSDLSFLIAYFFPVLFGSCKNKLKWVSLWHRCESEDMCSVEIFVEEGGCLNHTINKHRSVISARGRRSKENSLNFQDLEVAVSSSHSLIDFQHFRQLGLYPEASC